VPQARLYLVGAGNNAGDERHLRRRIAAEGLEGHVVLTGQLEREHAWEYVAVADVCVSPFRDIESLQSTSPTKLIEYMALERPVVASRHPEQDEILRESGAGLSAPYTEDAFAAAIVQILEDPASARAMGRRGRAWVREHRTYEIIGEFVDRRLRQVLAAGRPEGR
jgi:glycosyltransferase involved in cell wall biosynthesis